MSLPSTSHVTVTPYSTNANPLSPRHSTILSIVRCGTDKVSNLLIVQDVIDNRSNIVPEHSLEVPSGTSIPAILVDTVSLGHAASHTIDILDCAICYEIPSTFGIQENCAHVFCGGCLKEWRLPNSNATCPLCRVQSFRAIVIDSVPANAEKRTQLFEQVYAGRSPPPLPSTTPRSAWSSSSSTVNETQAQTQRTSIYRQYRSSSVTLQEARNLRYVEAHLERRQIGIRRSRLPVQRRRLTDFERRWSTLLTISQSAEDRVNSARVPGNISSLLCALHDYVSSLHSAASICQCILHEATSMLHDGRSLVADALRAMDISQEPQIQNSYVARAHDNIMSSEEASSADERSGFQLGLQSHENGHNSQTLFGGHYLATNNSSTETHSGGIIQHDSHAHIDSLNSQLSEANNAVLFAERAKQECGIRLHFIDEQIVHVQAEVHSLTWQMSHSYMDLAALHAELQMYRSTALLYQDQRQQYIDQQQAAPAFYD